MELALAICITLIVGAGGGFYSGVKITEKIKQGELNAKIELQREQLSEANRKLDSLVLVPEKVDTVIRYVTKIEQKTDTLILVSNKILQNTEEIKQDVKKIKDTVCN